MNVFWFLAGAFTAAATIAIFVLGWMAFGGEHPLTPAEYEIGLYEQIRETLESIHA